MDDAAKRFWFELDSALNLDEKMDVRDKGTTPTTPEMSRQVQTGAIVTITSAPPGAEILVDQNFVGNTPSSISVPAIPNLAVLAETSRKREQA